jgi:hypothetical protein
VEIERKNFMFFFNIAENIFEVFCLKKHFPEFQRKYIFFFRKIRLQKFNHL